MKKKTILLISVPIIILFTVVGLVFKNDLEIAWAAHQKRSLALEFMRQSQWTEAVTASHELLMFNPGSKDYQDTYNEACREFIGQLKTRVGGLQPYEGFTTIHDLALKLNTTLNDDGLNELAHMESEKEYQALAEVASAFDADMATLVSKFKDRETTFAEQFTPANQSQAKVMELAYANLVKAQTAWIVKDPATVAENLDGIPPAYQKSVYNNIANQLNSFRQPILDKIQGAKNLLAQNDYLGAKKIFDQLKGQESWVKDLQQFRRKAEADGENYYTTKMVESCLTRKSKFAGGWLHLLLQVQGKPEAGINFDTIFAPASTSDFLEKLSQCGLHAARQQDRHDYADTLLVAANLNNLTDPENANKFLGNTYYSWAGLQAQAGKYETACYLALLAEKHGKASADSVFQDARSHLANRYGVLIVATPTANLPASVDKDIDSSLCYEATTALKTGLPDWVKYTEDTGVLSTPDAAFKLKFLAGVKDFTSTYVQSFRTDSKEYPVYITVNNPDFATAQNDVAQDEADVARLNQVLDNTRTIAATSSQAGNSLASSGGLLGSVLATANDTSMQNGVGDAQRDVDNANEKLAEARNKLASTPQRIRSTENRTFSWDVTDHITTFDETFQIRLNAGAQDLWQDAFQSQVKHTASSWAANPKINLEGKERELPDADNIQSTLATDLKSKIEAVAGLTILRQIKESVEKLVRNSNTGSPDNLQDSLLGVEMLWWNLPLKNYSFLTGASLLVRFGDVIAAENDGTDSGGANQAMPGGGSTASQNSNGTYDSILDTQPATDFLASAAAKKKMGDLAGAIADFSKAIELNPTNSAAYNGRGDAEFEEGNVSAATADYNKAASLKYPL